MITQEELQKAVELSLDDDNKKTSLTTQLYQIIYLRECCLDTSDYECRLHKMYAENESYHDRYIVLRRELKNNRLKGLISKIDYDEAISSCNHHLAVSRMRQKVLGFVIGEISIEKLIGPKKYYEKTFNNII